MQETISENVNKEENDEGDEEQQVQVSFLLKPEVVTIDVL